MRGWNHHLRLLRIRKRARVTVKELRFLVVGARPAGTSSFRDGLCDIETFNGLASICIVAGTLRGVDGKGWRRHIERHRCTKEDGAFERLLWLLGASIRHYEARRQCPSLRKANDTIKWAVLLNDIPNQVVRFLELGRSRKFVETVKRSREIVVNAFTKD